MKSDLSEPENLGWKSFWLWDQYHRRSEWIQSANQGCGLTKGPKKGDGEMVALLDLLSFPIKGEIGRQYQCCRRSSLVEGAGVIRVQLPGLHRNHLFPPSKLSVQWCGYCCIDG